jgi:hypothetical protein
MAVTLRDNPPPPPPPPPPPLGIQASTTLRVIDTKNCSLDEIAFSLAKPSPTESPYLTLRMYRGSIYRDSSTRTLSIGHGSEGHFFDEDGALTDPEIKIRKMPVTLLSIVRIFLDPWPIAELDKLKLCVLLASLIDGANKAHKSKVREEPGSRWRVCSTVMVNDNTEDQSLECHREGDDDNGATSPGLDNEEGATISTADHRLAGRWSAVGNRPGKVRGRAIRRRLEVGRGQGRPGRSSAYF